MHMCAGGSERCRQYVCANAPGACIQMQMCLSGRRMQDILRSLKSLFSKWNDSIKGTMGILSPAM